MLRILFFLILAVVISPIYFNSPESKPKINFYWEIFLPSPANAQTSSETDGSQAQIENHVLEMVVGSQDAELTVVEYASFTCPHCAHFHKDVFKPLKENYIDTGKIRFVFREVYFDKYGMWASLVARCAGREKFFGLTNLILSTQDSWTRAGDDFAIVSELEKLGKMAGLEEDALQGCLQDADKLRALVKWYQKNATKDKIRSTPTFIINGTSYSNMDYQDFSEILDKELKGR